MLQKATVTITLAAVIFTASWAVAQPAVSVPNKRVPIKSGEVTIPWSEFKELLDRLEKLSKPGAEKPKPPTDYVLSAAYYRGEVRGKALVFDATIELEVFTDQYVKIPVFAASLPVEKTLLDGASVTLTPEKDWVQLVVRGAAKHELTFSFSLPITGEGEENISFKTARTATTLIDLMLPWADRDVQIAPISGLTTTTEGKLTHVKAVLPPTEQVTLSWTSALKKPYNIPFADYRARVEGNSVVVEANLKISVFAKMRVQIPLVSTAVALENVMIDSQTASPYIEGSRFAVYVEKPGDHVIAARFIAPVDTSTGPPRVTFDVPEVPVSSLAFDVPGGNYKIEVTPSQRVQVAYEKDKTTLKAILPVTQKIEVTWIAGVKPGEEEKPFVLSQTSTLCEFAEGVFRCTNLVEYDIRRGKLPLLSFVLPKDCEVFAVNGEDVNSWSETRDGTVRHLNVLFRFPKEKQASVQIVLEKLVSAIPAEFEMPVLEVEGVERNRGVVVFQLSEEYPISLKTSDSVVRVDANQIPANLRTVLKSGATADVYKYNRSPYQISVAITRPPVVPARLNADFSLLATIEEESIKCDGVANYEIVGGQIESLKMILPEGVWVNTVAASDLKNYAVKKTSSTQEVTIEFQRKAKGKVAVTINYEFPIKETVTSATVPVIIPVPEFPGVERLRQTYAVAAPPHIEVVPVEPTAKGVLSVNEIPAELKNRATMPVLLAFQFVRAPEPVRLKVLKHTHVAVQDVVIDSANVTTIHTREGIEVTMVSLSVYNSRRQFLKTTLPKDSKIWNVFVGGEAISPAKDAEGRILIPLRKSGPGSSDQAVFSVDVIYMQSGDPMKRWGRLKACLPQFDIAINELVWSLYLPDEYRYYRQTGNIRPMTTTYQRINLQRQETYEVSSLYQFSGEMSKDTEVRAGVKRELEEAKGRPGAGAGQPAGTPTFRNLSLQRQAQVENDLLELGQQKIPDRFRRSAAPTQPGVTGKPVEPPRPILPLRVSIPTEGKMFRFSRTIVPENADSAYIEISYSKSWLVKLLFLMSVAIASPVATRGWIRFRKQRARKSEQPKAKAESQKASS